MTDDLRAHLRAVWTPEKRAALAALMRRRWAADDGTWLGHVRAARAADHDARMERMPRVRAAALAAGMDPAHLPPAKRIVADSAVVRERKCAALRAASAAARAARLHRLGLTEAEFQLFRLARRKGFAEGEAVEWAKWQARAAA